MHTIQWERREWIIFTIILPIVVIVVWFGQKGYFNYQQYHNRPQSHQFTGQLMQVLNDGRLVLKGTHVNDTDPDKSDYTHPTVVTVIVTPDTKFVKTLLYLPTKAETAKTGGVFYPKDLKREQVAGSLNDFKTEQGLGLTIKTKDSTYLEDKVIIAIEIDYIKPVYPK